MATKKPKLSPIEREIKTRTRRVEKAQERIDTIRKKAESEVAEVKANLQRDQAVLNALIESQKK